MIWKHPSLGIARLKPTVDVIFHETAGFPTNTIKEALHGIFLVRLRVAPAIAVADGDTESEDEQKLEHDVGGWCRRPCVGRLLYQTRR